MAKNRGFEGYPATCLAELDRNRGFAITLAWASGYLLEDVHREILGAAWAGEDLRRVVPARLGVRRLPTGQWLSADLHVMARFNAAAEENIVEMPSRSLRRSALVAGLAEDQGIGLRAAQKRVKKILEQARRQGDLFAGEGE